MITLHVLGAGGAVPTATHGPAAYWLEAGGRGVLLDPGPGALVRLVRQAGAPDDVDEVDTVVFTHLHLYHTADLAPLLFAAHSILARRTTPLRLVGPGGLGRLLAALRGVYGEWLTPRSRQLEIEEVRPGDEVTIGTAVWRAFAAVHDEPRYSETCLGWSIRDHEGAHLVFSGDTGPGPELPRMAAACDLLLVECSTPDALAVPTHLSPAGVAEIARNARPRRVVLTHMYPPVVAEDPAGAVARASGVPCVAARDGDVFEIAARPQETP
jgi:ribonuclease BN (tRNA processing enzyme)